MRLMHRRLGSAIAGVLISLSVTVVPGPASADELATAQARVDSLQARAAQSTRTLVAGTRAWEADVAKLRAVELKLHNSRRRVVEAQREMDAAAAKVSALAADLYKSPYGHGLTIAFGSKPETFLDAASSLQLLDKAAGGQNRVIAEAATARVRLRTEQAGIEQSTQLARDLVARSAERLRSLKRLAAETARELDAAQDALLSAKSKAAARERATRASRARTSVSGGGAFCTGKSTSGQSNGNLDPASLCPLWQASGHRLVSNAANAFNAMSKHHAETRGRPLCVTSSYRTYSEQASLYQSKPGLAAVPGTSEHGWGKAVDLCDGVEDFGSAEHEWMRDNAGRFGWYHPDWARQGGSRPEAWHWEYGG